MMSIPGKAGSNSRLLRSFELIQAQTHQQRARTILDGLPTWALIGLVGVAYFGLAKIGLSFAANNEIVSAVWPPSGLGLAAVFMLGYRVLPGVAVAAFISNATGDSSIGVAAGIAFGNTLAAALGAWLLHRARFNPNLQEIRDVIVLAILGASIAPALNATIGNSTLWISGVIDSSELWRDWRVWWLGDLTGILLCAPPILLLLIGRHNQPIPIAKVAEATAGLALLTFATILLLSHEVTLVYPVFPLLVLIGMRYRQPGAVIAAPIVSILCIYFTGHDEGPFVGGDPAEDLLQAQVFVALAALTSLMVAAVRTEWERSVNAMNALAENREALAEAQELAHIGSWEWEIGQDRVVWTDELYRIFGLEKKDGKSTFDAYLQGIHPDDRERTRSAIENALRTDTPFHLEHRIVRPDGEYRHLDCHGRFTYDDSGRQLKMIGTAQDVTAQREAEEQLNFLAMHDPLTGLANRSLFLERVGQALAQADESHKVAVLFCDLDDFKNVNDNLGHESGDQLLAALPPRLRLAADPGTTIARFGGDEFVVLLENLEDEAEAFEIAEGISEALSRPIEAGGRTHHISVSIGIVFAKPGTTSAGEVLRDADAAMYRAKSVGRGEISIFDDRLRADLIQRIAIENDLRDALTRDELELEYQPVISISTLKLIGAEALIRWRHPVQGMLYPDEFVGVAERAGMINELGMWVLEKACRDAVRWLDSCGRRDLSMSVNLSASQISDKGLAEKVGEVLQRTGLPPERLALEITESALLEQGPLPIENMRRLRELGTRLILDDFGTGYSSLSYLKRIPFDVIKIDQEFVADLGESDEDAAIVKAILAISKVFGADVVAEGVETREQFDWLKDHGCRFAQGFHLTEPLTLTRLLEIT